MNIIYIFRPKGIEYSIEKVFKPIMNDIRQQNECVVEESHALVKSNFFNTHWANIRKYASMSRTDSICHITCEVRYCGIFMKSSHTVLTTHDTISLCNPDAPWYARWYAYWFQFYLPMRHLKYLTCISEATKNELISYFPWAASKIRVIHNPVDTGFSFHEKALNSQRPIILHIGTRSNKNLIRVATSLKGMNCHLRIIGQLSDEQRNTLKENEIDYSNAMHLTDNEIVNEYINSDIVSFPSLFEGFGMPIIEAQAVGRPVLTSDREPMRSVAGDAAMLVNPENTDSIREGFMKLMSDDELYKRCVVKGLENVKKYKHEIISQQYLDLYKEIENNNKSIK